MQNKKTFLLMEIVGKTYKFIKDHPKRSLFICYVLSFVFVTLAVLLIGLVNYVLFALGIYVQKDMKISDFELVGIEIIDENTIETATEDAQLIAEHESDIRSLHITLNYERDPGEVNAFYLGANDAAFGIDRSIYGKYDDGTYVFNFPPGTKKIRFDCGITSSNIIEVESIVINRATFSDLVPFNSTAIFIIFILPLIIIPATYYATGIIKKRYMLAKINK